MASLGGNGAAAKRLKSWKEIAAFFGADERTVRRWEERGLPVHRIPGGAGATVYAESDELESWFRGQPPALPSPSRRSRRWTAFAGLALAALAGAGTIVLWRSGSESAAVARHQPSQQAAELYLAGTYQFERRTGESLRQALGLFGRAIVEDPAYADAYAGLANTYLLLREYAGMPDAEAYPRAQAAADRALALDPGLAQAHAARAFATFYWERDWRGGLRGFDEAIRLDPRSARARHWHATALLHSGDIQRALSVINAAQRLDPQSRSILADKALILFHAGRREEATAILRPMAANEPEFLSPHAYLARIYRAAGDDRAYLREARIAARIVGAADRLAMLDEAERAYATGGREAMLHAMLAGQQRLRAAGRESAYGLAATYTAMGDRTMALRLLGESERAREPEIMSVRVDPALSPLHGEAGFREMAARIGRLG